MSLELCRMVFNLCTRHNSWLRPSGWEFREEECWDVPAAEEGTGLTWLALSEDPAAVRGASAPGLTYRPLCCHSHCGFGLVVVPHTAFSSKMCQKLMLGPRSQGTHGAGQGMDICS